jgi:RNA 2',3'-cyclic 3'-phosphodiesterase
MIRTFIALDLPLSVRDSIAELEKDFQKTGANVSWIKPASIHLTLKFLGNVHEEKIEEIQSAIQEVAESTSPFRLQPHGCGAFPTIKQMRVVWVGLQGDSEPLKMLQKRVEEALIPLGFEAEGRPFKPHLTIGRVKGRQGMRALQDLLVSRQGFSAEAFDVIELLLYKSELRPEGARYTPLFRAPLAGRL